MADKKTNFKSADLTLTWDDKEGFGTRSRAMPLTMEEIAVLEQGARYVSNLYDNSLKNEPGMNDEIKARCQHQKDVASLLSYKLHKLKW